MSRICRRHGLQPRAIGVVYSQNCSVVAVVLAMLLWSADDPVSLQVTLLNETGCIAERFDPELMDSGSDGRIAGRSCGYCMSLVHEFKSKPKICMLQTWSFGKGYRRSMTPTFQNSY